MHPVGGHACCRGRGYEWSALGWRCTVHVHVRVHVQGHQRPANEQERRLVPFAHMAVAGPAVKHPNMQRRGRR